MQAKKLNTDNDIMPVVGMGLTVHMYTDRLAFTIISVSASGKSFTAIEDNATRTDNNGMSDCQNYSYSSSPNGQVLKFRLGTKTNRFKSKLGYASLGVRNKYHDFCF